MRVVAVHAVELATAAYQASLVGLTPAPFADAGEMEQSIRSQDWIRGVLDLSLADLADGSAAADRLTAASARGLPQVVAPGGLPAALTPEAADRLGLDVAQRVSASRGPAAVLLPLRGLTPAAEVFNQCVRNWAYGFELVEVDLTAADPAFAAAACDALLRLMGLASGVSPTR